MCKLLKLFVAPLCALYACMLPLSLSKPHEISFTLKPVRAVVALPAPKVVSFSELSLVDVPAPVQAPVVMAAPVGNGACGDNEYANYIYMHESGCNPGSVNSIGCSGIGQSCSPDVLRLACPALDYACENIFFTKYANTRYGGWYESYQFWLQNHWW